MRWLVKIADGLNTLKDIPPLLFRLLLTYGFWHPFMFKWNNMEAFTKFVEGLHYPFPHVSAYLAMITEGLGMICLFFGFATRIASIPLMFMMVLAIFTVHLPHGYNPGENGFAIPLVYGLMLFSLFITGPGKVSVDGLLAGPARRKSNEG